MYLILGGRNIDVDASVIIFDEKDTHFRKTDIVYYGKKNYRSAVMHGGDNLTGDGEGDDETIQINLDRMDNDNEADVCAVVVNIYSGSASFSSIRNCFARLVDDRNKELCRFNLTDEYDTQAMIMCHIEKRKNGCWAMITDGVGCSGSRASSSVDDVMKILRGEQS